MYILRSGGNNPLTNETEERLKMDNKERKPINKKLYIALISCITAAIVVIVAVSLAVGLRGADEPVGPGNTVVDIPDDTDKPDDTDDTDDPDDTDDTDAPDEPTVTVPEYSLPLSDCVLGAACSLEELVWSDTLQWYATHNGADFTAEAGTAVASVHDGEVESVGYTTRDGYTVTVAQTDGYTAVYKSLSADIPVEEGQTVAMGDTIGYVSDSMTSEQNAGAHLHLEILDGSGNYVDPMTLLDDATEK